MRCLQSSGLLFFTTHLISFAVGACVPDYPEKLLADPAVLQHPAVVAAFEEVGRNLSKLYVNTTRDGLSFAVVSAITIFYIGRKLMFKDRYMPQRLAPCTRSTMAPSR